MNDRQFTIGGKTFQLNKIDALKQFHIVRRVGPILADVIPAIKGAEKFQDPKALESLSPDAKMEMMAKIAMPVMNGLSKLNDADAELVLYGLLSSVEVKHAGAWARVSTSTMLMMQDLELPALLSIAGRAFIFNLSGFFTALP